MIYTKQEDYVNSHIVFIHQDVQINNDFFIKVNKLFIDVPDNAALFGFAGVDTQGKGHVFIKDSDYFVFSGTDEIKEVESVDEFLFIIDVNIFIKEKIYLSNIPSWHAYAAEFSIILRNYKYKTFYLPLYAFHNSVRTNNNGIYETHRELFKIYNKNCRTLCGDMSNKSISYNAKKQVYSIYTNKIKFNKNLKLINLIKYYLLDLLNIKLNISRFIYYYKSSRNNIYYYFISNNMLDTFINIDFKNGRLLNFSIIKEIDINKLNLTKDRITYIKGFKQKINNSNKYIEKDDLNIFY